MYSSTDPRDETYKEGMDHSIALGIVLIIFTCQDPHCNNFGNHCVRFWNEHSEICEGGFEDWVPYQGVPCQNTTVSYQRITTF